MNYKSIQNCFVMLLAIVLPLTTIAQRKKAKADELSSVKNFVRVNTLFEQLPLYMETEIQQTGNGLDSFITVQFYLNKSTAYIRFGDTEQLINDSITLVVNDEMQRMFLYRNARSVEEHIKWISNMQLKDSSVEAIAKKYKAATSVSNKEVTITLENKTLLPRTDLPKDVTELTYKSGTNLPVQMTVINRSLVALDEETYSSLSLDSTWKSKLFAIENKAFFLVKEERTIFRYKEIRHEPVKFPALIADRIIIKPDGELMPAKNYEAYTVTVN